MAAKCDHRKIISDNLTILAKNTNLDQIILDECVSREIFTSSQRSKIKQAGPLHEYESKSYLYNHVLKLSDVETFKKFVELCKEKETKQSEDVVKILMEGISIPTSLPKFNFNKVREDGKPYEQWTWQDTSKDEVSLQKYKVRPEFKFALVVNISIFSNGNDRNGANYDTLVMAKVLKEFGYDVSEIEGNITLKELKEKINTFKVTCKDGDACIVVVMSHGTRDTIATSEGKEVSINWDILAQFNNSSFKEFIGKPKVFILQACRGYEHDTRSMQDDSTFTNRRNNMKIPSWTDMLICYATVEGYPAYREHNGSWFIQILCQQIMNYGKRLDINQILIMVAEQMKREESSEGNKQICPWTNIGFTKQFFL